MLVYNTRTHKKQELNPLVPGHIRMYSLCNGGRQPQCGYTTAGAQSQIVVSGSDCGPDSGQHRYLIDMPLKG